MREELLHKIDAMDANSLFTTHGRKRMKKRNGWSKKASERMIKRILANGEDMKEKTGYLGLWARAKLKNEQNDHRYLLYGTQVYIFTNETLITVFPMPSRQQAFKKAAGGLR